MESSQLLWFLYFSYRRHTSNFGLGEEQGSFSLFEVPIESKLGRRCKTKPGGLGGLYYQVM